MRQILFYGFVFDARVAEFIRELEFAKDIGEDIKVKINSMGGDVFSGWGMISEFRDFPNQKEVLVHGNASSMMSVFVMFAEETTCLEQTKFILHRASANRNDEETLKMLKDTNDDIRKAFEEKLDIEKFEEIAGVDLDRFFDETKPAVDVQLNASQAKDVGLIKNVVPLSVKEAEATNQSMIEACGGQGVYMLSVEKKESKKTKKSDQKNTKMTLKELKAEHPNLVAALIAEATPDIQEAAIKQERERTNSWLAWKDVDAKAAIEGVLSGDDLTAAKSEEFKVTGLKNGFVANASGQKPVGDGDEDDGGDDGSDDDDSKDAEQFEAKVRSMIGMKAS